MADTEWILSVSRDKSLQWCCTKTGRKLGGFEAQAWCLDVEYDTSSKYVFVADYSGQINVLRLDTQGFQFITTLKGHQSVFDKTSSIHVHVVCLQYVVCSTVKPENCAVVLIVHFVRLKKSHNFCPHN